MLIKMLRAVLPRASRVAAVAAERVSDAGVPLSTGSLAASQCKICRGDAYLFDVVDFNKQCSADGYEYPLAGIPVYYSRCIDCGFVYTNHFDTWSQEQFARLIYNHDYVKVDPDFLRERPLRVANAFAQSWSDAKNASILDYGCGSGVFGHRLQALGYRNVAGYDPFSSPARPDGRFDLITCTEVMEHAHDPHATLRNMLTFAHPESVILFTTLVQPDDIEQMRAAWWYIAPRNGHVSIYSHGALDALAAAQGLYYLPDDGFHAFSAGADAPQLRGRRPCFGATLYAPAREDPQWHGIEHGAQGPLRWSARSAISWSCAPPLLPCSVHLRIPFIAEAAPGVAACCMLEHGGTRYPVSVSRLAHWKVLIGRVELTAPDGAVALLLPPLPENTCGNGLALPMHPDEDKAVVQTRVA